MRDEEFDGLDIGFCPRCGVEMSGEPAAAVICGRCAAEDDE